MNKKLLNEGLDYQDLVGQIGDKVTVDEYAAKMGKDSDIVTIAFTVNSEGAGNDLSDWFERGYDYVLDAQVSDGEVSPGKYLVFVEMNRRSTVPERLIEMLEDLKTLTDLDVKDYVIEVNEEDYEADVEVLKQVMTLSPHDYREEEEQEEEESDLALNEMREIAGLQTRKIYTEDAAIKAFKSMAGL